MTSPTQPNQITSTVHNISDGMWCLQKEKSWQPQSEKPASSRACPAEPGEQLPTPVTGTNRSCCLTTSALLAAACTQQRRRFLLSASDTRQWTLLSVWLQSSLELTDGEGSMRGILMSSLEFRTLSLLQVQELTVSPMVSWDPIQFQTATSTPSYTVKGLGFSLPQPQVKLLLPTP